MMFLQLYIFAIINQTFNKILQFYNKYRKYLKGTKVLNKMINASDQNQTIFFRNKNIISRHLNTQNCLENNQSQKHVAKWSQNTFYHQVKKKIHEKLRTQPCSQMLVQNKLKNSKTVNKKPKSKLSIFTLEIGLDPLINKVSEEPFQIQRRIYRKVQQNVNLIKTGQVNITRNMSAKLVRQKTSLCNSPRMVYKKQLVQTSRKNSKIVVKAAPKDKLKLLTKSKNLPSPSKASQQDLLVEYKSSDDTGQNVVVQDMHLKRISSSITKKSQTSPSKVSTFNIKPLLFYFKAKNSIKISNREMSIKKIRVKSNLNKRTYAGVP